MTDKATELPQAVPAVGAQVDRVVRPGAEALHPWAAEILKLLDQKYGTATGDLAQQHSSLKRWGHNRRMQSAAALSVLRQLEKAGYVRKMDGERPIAWVRVRA